jgi:hypothetical protein
MKKRENMSSQKPTVNTVGVSRQVVVFHVQVTQKKDMPSEVAKIFRDEVLPGNCFEPKNSRQKETYAQIRGLTAENVKLFLHWFVLSHAASSRLHHLQSSSLT